MSQQQETNPAELYEEYLVPGIHARWTPVFLDYAEPRAGDHVLDVACGTGIVARNVAPLVGERGRVAALDVSPDMVAVGRALPEPAGATIEWREGSADALPDGPFDRVLCQQGLQFFPDRAAAVQEMQRVLNSGGSVTLSVFRGLEHHALYRALLEAEARYLGTPVDELATPFSFGNADELHSLLDAAGFKQIDITPESHPVSFPSPQRFVTFTLLAATAIEPDAEMDSEARAELVEVVSGEIDDTLQAYVEGDTVTFPMHANIATAQA